ncbi:MAG: hypothetical protein L6Q54_03330 [Leptospiraceae bacterium]|nr:hypothetical protein [Leptospiraceae bacterium]MCK6380269.1 hypothetical protein [Leptospiraceae bacterium]NUM41096.1 hypothetical protein [Leptospiraceae bacterium]
MSKILEEERKKLLSAKTPEQYIERSIKSKLKPGQKGSITIEWLRKTGFTSEDIHKARNRNAHWRAQKGLGSYERNQRRLQKFNFLVKKNSQAKREWTEKDLNKLYDMNKTMTDWELAKHFKTTIPSINHLRRKFRLAEDILLANREKPNKGKILKYAQRAEKVLRKELNG